MLVLIFQSLNPHPGESFDLQLCLKQDSYSRCFPLPRTTVVPWLDFNANKYWILPTAVLLGAISLATLLLFIKPLLLLSLYRKVFIYELLDKSSIPGMGLVKVLLQATLLPFFAFHRRTIRAWTAKHRVSFQSRWDRDVASFGTALSNTSYIALPVEMRAAGAIVLISEPSPAKFPSLLEHPGIVEIRGPGGIGKTTLLGQLGKWLLEPKSAKFISATPILPIILDLSGAPVDENLRLKVESICGEEISSEFLRHLLRTGSLVIFIDGFSEANLQQEVSQMLRQYSARNTVLSCRTTTETFSIQRTELLPQPLDSRTLLHFITSLLSQLPEDKHVINTMELQLELGTHIVGIIKTGIGDSPLTPLLVNLLVIRAVDLMSDGQSLDQLPSSVAAAYFDYIRELVRAVPNVNSETALKGVKALARASVAERFVPSRVSSDEAMRILDPILGEVKTATVDNLVSSGLLVKESFGLASTLAFGLDPLAEFCAADSYLQSCGNDLEKWRSLALQLRNAGPRASGFRFAIAAVAESYADSGLISSVDVLKLINEPPPPESKLEEHAATTDSQARTAG